MTLDREWETCDEHARDTVKNYSERSGKKKGTGKEHVESRPTFKGEDVLHQLRNRGKSGAGEFGRWGGLPGRMRAVMPR